MAAHYKPPDPFTRYVLNPLVAGLTRLRLGRRRREMTLTELEDDAKVAVLRAYLGRWGWETGMFFDGVKADSDEGELRRIAPDHPVFRLEPS